MPPKRVATVQRAVAKRSPGNMVVIWRGERSFTLAGMNAPNLRSIHLAAEENTCVCARVPVFKSIVS